MGKCNGGEDGSCCNRMAFWVHYKLVEWRSYEYILYEANYDFCLSARRAVCAGEVICGDDVRLFETGEVDVAGVGLVFCRTHSRPHRAIECQPAHRRGSMHKLCGLRYPVPPFDDVNVRKAFSMAFDRQRYVEVLYRGLAPPRRWFIPARFAGFDYGLRRRAFDLNKRVSCLPNPNTADRQACRNRVHQCRHWQLCGRQCCRHWQKCESSISVLGSRWKTSITTSTMSRSSPAITGRSLTVAGVPITLTPKILPMFFFTAVCRRIMAATPTPTRCLLESARIEPDVAKRIDMYQQKPGA